MEQESKNPWRRFLAEHPNPTPEDFLQLIESLKRESYFVETEETRGDHIQLIKLVALSIGYIDDITKEDKKHLAQCDLCHKEYKRIKEDLESQRAKREEHLKECVICH